MRCGDGKKPSRRKAHEGAQHPVAGSPRGESEDRAQARRRRRAQHP
jgi:hypothetical protein